MGRAGSGGGGRASSGGHSSSRSGGGHRVGGSHSSGSRAGSGSFGGSSRAPRGGPGMPPPRHGGGPGMPPPPPHRGGPGMPPPPPHRGGPGMPPPPPPRGGYRGRPPRRSGGCLTNVMAFIVIMIILFLVFQSSASHMIRTAGLSSKSSQSSTIVREKLDTNNSYINDCVIDELGWFDSVSKTESRLKDFWEKTGVQPYIILRDYDAGLSTDLQKEQWATDYYEEHFDTENIFLFVYFAEEDVDNDVGYMAYANGYQTSSVMDSEAIEIFWNNIDKYWYTDLSTDDLFVNAFRDTANTIMHVSTTGKDILKWVLIVVAIILVGIIVIRLIKQKNQREKEKAEEDQRILNTPIHDIAKDDLENKYL